MVGKMLGPDAVSAYALSKSSGLSAVTLSRWRNEASSLGPMSSRRPAQESPRKKKSLRGADEKLALLIEASKLGDAELGAFLRREGIHEADLVRWRESSLEGLSGKVAAGAAASASDKRVRELERELRRKEKALAEAAALLVLQKKVRRLWGDEDDDT